MKMLGGTRPLIDRMCPVRIFHKLKGLIIFHQLIDQHLGVIKMHIIVMIIPITDITMGIAITGIIMSTIGIIW